MQPFPDGKETAPAGRIQTIEACRVIAIAGVVLLHSVEIGDWIAAANPLKAFAACIIQTFTRFAVPFFLITSGFFYGSALDKAGKREKLRVFKKSAGRILLVYALWTLIYAFLPWNFLSSLLEKGFVEGFLKRAWWCFRENAAAAGDDPVSFLVRGTKLHLWFFSSLLLGFVAVTPIESAASKRLALFFSLVSFGAALYFKTYIYPPEEARSLNLFYSRYSFLFGVPFVVLGRLLAKWNTPRLENRGAALAAAGFAVCMLELWLLRHYRPGVTGDGVLAGTAVLGPGVFLTCLRYKRVELPVISGLGKYVLGIYVSHIAVVMASVKYFDRFPDYVTWAVLPALVFLISLSFTAVLWRIPVISRLVK